MSALTTRTVRKLPFLLILIFFSLTILLHRNEITSIDAPIPETPTKVLFAFVAVGNAAERQELTKANIDLLISQRDEYKHKYHVDCILFSWARYKESPDWLHSFDRNTSDFCKVVRIFGFDFVSFLRSLFPHLLEKSGYKYLTLQMDDVALFSPFGNYKLLSFFDAMERHNLAMASPAVIGSFHRPLQPHPISHAKQLGRYMNSLEIQSLALRLDAWACMWELIDNEFPSGWGLDLWFEEYCTNSGRIPGKSVAVFDFIHVNHNPHHWGSTSGVGKDLNALVREQFLSWQEQRNITLIGRPFKEYGMLLDEPIEGEDTRTATN